MLVIDTETLGLDPARHRPFEVAIIDVDAESWDRYIWRPHPRWIAQADVRALEINRMFDRVPQVHAAEAEAVYAEMIAAKIDGQTICGSNPDFDVRMLTAWLADHGLPCRPHYRTVDVPTLAAGRLLAAGETVTWPISSWHISQRLGVPPPPADQAHTALADAMWCWRLLLACQTPA